MQMELHIYSIVNVKNQAVNIWDKDKTTTQKGQRP